jgi:hypothetical protein
MISMSYKDDLTPANERRLYCVNHPTIRALTMADGEPVCLICYRSRTTQAPITADTEAIRRAVEAGYITEHEAHILRMRLEWRRRR